jgi:hypothetical protein
MENILASLIFTLSSLALSMLVLKYWNKKLLKDFNSTETNSAYSVFLFFQVLSIFTSTYLSFDLQTLNVLESFNPFLRSDFQNYWSVFGIYLVCLLFIYSLSVFLTLITYKMLIVSSKDFKEHINQNNTSIALVVGVLILSIVLSLAHFSLRPLLNEWVLGGIGFVPMN